MGKPASLLLLRHGFDQLILVLFMVPAFTLGSVDCFLFSVSPLVALPPVAECPCISHIHTPRDTGSV